MLICRSRDEMKRHLTARLDILRGQKAASKGGIAGAGISARMEGIKEAIELIDAWEQWDASAELDISTPSPAD